MSKISIIIPTFNSEKYLRECLDSIIGQTFKDYEIIIINDGSNDYSGTICEEYACNHQIIVFHQENKGVSVARNKGIELATGKWISFVDADDVVSKDYAESFFKQNRLADLTFFAHINFNNEDGIERTYTLKPSYCNTREDIEKQILNLKHNDQDFEFFGYTWNKFFRLDIIKEHNIRFVEGLKFREDEIFTAEYCKHINSLAVMSDNIYRYRCSTGGLTSHKMQSKDFLQVAKLVEQCSLQFSYQELVQYENYRIMYMLLDAMRESHSIIERFNIAKEIKQFNSRCNGLYDYNKLPYGLVKNANNPFGLLLWLYRRY